MSGAPEPPGAQGQLLVTSRGDVSVAQDQIRQACLALGWPEQAREEFVVAASELAQNALDHGGGRGTLTWGGLPERGLRLEVRDSGPGLDPALVDRARGLGAGRLRQGLAAAARLCDHLHLSFAPGGGTCALGRRWPQSGVQRGLRVLSLNRPCRGEQVSGDEVVALRLADGWRVAVVDGLGHGARAAEAARAARAALEEPLPFESALARAHAASRVTRGNAALVAEIHGGALRATGVGNVRGTLWRGLEQESLVSRGGVLGQERDPRQRDPWGRVQELGWDPRACLLLASDGLSSRGLADAAGARLRADPSGETLRLFANHAVERDDATLLLLTS